MTMNKIQLQGNYNLHFDRLPVLKNCKDNVIYMEHEGFSYEFLVETGKITRCNAEGIIIQPENEKIVLVLGEELGKVRCSKDIPFPIAKVSEKLPIPPIAPIAIPSDSVFAWGTTQKIELTSKDIGQIRYTLDGSDPSQSALKYDGPILIEDATENPNIYSVRTDVTAEFLEEEVQKYYNDQIDALKRENEEIEQQNELLEYQKALQEAKAKKVMVFKEGKFQLVEDEGAVSQAAQNLANYQSKLDYEKQIQQLEDLRDATVETLEERIEALEEYYEYMEDYYDRQIESMEEYYDKVQENYEKQIEALQEQLDAFKEGYQKQEDLENARLAAQVLGINERSLLYEQDLENLKNYINATNKMLESLGEAGVTVENDYKGVTASTKGVSKVASVDTVVPKKRASGDASFSGDEIALVGESPNTELILGSHINSLGGGSLVNLSKGSGVVNAESTSTLAGLLNGLANPTSIANNRTVQQNFSFGNISLPSVTDGNSFVKALSTQFNNYAIQYGNVRK